MKSFKLGKADEVVTVKRKVKIAKPVLPPPIPESELKRLNTVRRTAGVKPLMQQTLLRF
jgi:hypothetical protein